MSAAAATAPEPTASSQNGGHKHVHRFLVPTLLVLATLSLLAGCFAVWVNRQALNTDNWEDTSAKLLANEKIDDALGAYLVDQVFTGDVAAAVQQKLPPPLKPLAGPAASGLKQLAEQRAPIFLARPKVQDAWVAANRAAHRQLRAILDGGGKTISTTNGEVRLQLRPLVASLATDLGISSQQISAAQSKLQGSKGQIQAAAQNKLGVTLPATSGDLVIMKSDQLKTAQDIASAVKGLAIVLPALAIALFALAIYLARDRRRHALRTSGWLFVAVGVALLLIRRVGGNEIVDSLVKVPSNKPAIHEVWNIATSLLYAIAIAMVIYGLIFVVCAWIAGSTRPATFLREWAAPSLRESPAVAYAGAGGLLLLLVAWGPTPAFKQIAWVLVFAALLALGVTMLRRQTAVEFPDGQHGDAVRHLRQRRAAAKAVEVAEPRTEAPASAATAVRSATLDEIERLVSLHNDGTLSDSEFETAKDRMMAGA